MKKQDYIDEVTGILKSISDISLSYLTSEALENTNKMSRKKVKTADIRYGVEDDALRVVFEELGYKCNILPNK